MRGADPGRTRRRHTRRPNWARAGRTRLRHTRGPNWARAGRTRLRHTHGTDGARGTDGASCWPPGASGQVPDRI